MSLDVDLEIVLQATKPRFALDEPVLLGVGAVNLSDRLVEGPLLDGPSPNVALELRRAGATWQTFRPERNLGARPEPPPALGRAQIVRGTLDARRLARGLAAGSYEAVVVHETTGARSAPVSFEIARAAVIAAHAAPVSGTGEDERQLLRLESRPGGAALVLVRPILEEEGMERVGVDLGAASPRSRIALSVSSPRFADERAWAVALDGSTLARRFADRALGGHALPDILIPAPEAQLVGALAGVLEKPAPPLVFTRGVDLDGWPRLHVAFLAAGELLAVSASPDVGVPPTWHRASLGKPVAARVCALDQERRVVFVARRLAERLRIDAIPWTDRGFDAPVSVIETAGTLLDLEALADPRGAEARVVALVAADDRLVLETGRIDARGAAFRVGARVIPPEQRPDDMLEPRLRVAWENEVYILARRGTGEPILVVPGSREPWRVPVPRGAWWDIEIDRDGPHALRVDEERGAVALELEPPG